MNFATAGLLLGLAIAACIFIFGPLVVGVVDCACWFATGAQCTTVIWNDIRVMWALAPVFLAIVVIFGGMA